MDYGKELLELALKEFNQLTSEEFSQLCAESLDNEESDTRIYIPLDENTRPNDNMDNTVTKPESAE
ncbi:MAG: hypothetical protein ACR2PY_04435 [Salinispira sp.]